MISVEELKKDPALKKFFRTLSARLFIVMNGVLENYLALCEQYPNDKDDPDLWDTYDAQFDNKILAPMLSVLDENSCGTGEACIAALKLLNIASESMENISESKTWASSKSSSIKIVGEVKF